MELLGRDREKRGTDRKITKLLDKIEALRHEHEALLEVIELGADESSGESERDCLIRTGRLNPLEHVPTTSSPRSPTTSRFVTSISSPLPDFTNLSDEDDQDNLYFDDFHDESFVRRIKRFKPTENEKSVIQVDGTFLMPQDLWEKLFNYQKTSVKWLWELHKQGFGGILGDEMGLGKTLQAIAFLAGLYTSNLYANCALIVCPATVLKQWAQEFHRWFPDIRVCIFHSSCNTIEQPSRTLRSMYTKSNVVLTSYSLMQIYQDFFLKLDWFYLILDEGHKIRNPEAKITLACKSIRTPHKICLTGTPIQNNLLELWSLVDFVSPGKLGSLSVFKTEFAIPINMGGYSNAGPLQIQTSYKCACTLRDLIRPLLLRRWKKDVAQHLPSKVEHVCLCQITEFQRQLYEDYLSSSQLSGILSGTINMLVGIDTLRKICNHPFLLRGSSSWSDSDDEITAHLSPFELSGKYKVLRELLVGWKRENHKVLIFCQTRQMLDLLEVFMKSFPSFSYCRMDGATDVSKRSSIVDRFNNDPTLFCFLLTTKVGGIGINLTGASRVVIYDPDWNPSTDLQARERAWRYGQTRDVQICRLITAGTIEEKIYHRQIFKQILTNRILHNPKLSRFFKPSDIHDLFSLSVQDMKPSSIPDLASPSSAVSSADQPEVPLPHKEAPTDGILDSLFTAAGVKIKIHEEVVNAFSTPDATFLNREAEKIVSHSMKLLQESNPYPEQLYVLSKSVPMLTSERAEMSDVSASPSTPRRNIDQDEVNPLAKMLVAFLKSNNGSATTDQILGEFENKINPADAILFRQLLKAVATLTPVNSTSKTWVLKSSLL